MRTFYIFLICICSVKIACATPAVQQVRPVDQAERKKFDQAVTQRLFDQYVNNSVRIQTSEVKAAIELVGARGGGDLAFRQTVLAAFEKACEDDRSTTKRRLLKVIKKFLWRGGIERWRGPNTESVQTFYANMSAEELKAESMMLASIIRNAGNDTFLTVLSVRESHHPEGKEFLLNILQKTNNKGMAFYAAVGLAELGEASGVEWLLENSKPSPAAKSQLDRQAGFAVRHFYASAQNTLAENCRLALGDLFGLGTDPQRSVDQLQAFWNEHQAKFNPTSVSLNVDN